MQDFKTLRQPVWVSNKSGANKTSKKFCSHRRGSLLLGLCTQDPPLGRSCISFPKHSLLAGEPCECSIHVQTGIDSLFVTKLYRKEQCFCMSLLEQKKCSGFGYT